MVLCVSGILWPSGASDSALPELEVTDGWYTLRATLDSPLARAVKKGSLKIGRKIAVSGASVRFTLPLFWLLVSFVCMMQLWSDSKEPQEILEGGNAAKLTICANGTHLVPWHTKLGFLPSCPISTTHSLISDGGVVPRMDVVVMQVSATSFASSQATFKQFVT